MNAAKFSIVTLLLISSFLAFGESVGSLTGTNAGKLSDEATATKSSIVDKSFLDKLGFFPKSLAAKLKLTSNVIKHHELLSSAEIETLLAPYRPTDKRNLVTTGNQAAKNFQAGYLNLYVLRPHLSANK